MKLISIDYQGGQIWVDKEIITGCTFHIDGRIEKCLKIEQNRVYISENEFYHLFTIRGMEILSEQLCMRVVAQSINLSLPNIPYVEIEEDIEKLAIEFANNNKSKFNNWYGAHDGFLAGYKAVSAKKYTEEDLREAFEAGRQCELFNRAPNEDEYIKSLQSKVVSIEIEMKKTYREIFDGEQTIHTHEGWKPVTYQRDGKTFLKVKSVQYE